MQVEINGVWEVLNLDQVRDGKYRVLFHSPGTGHVILYDLEHEKKLKKPILVPYTIFIDGIKNQKCKESSHPSPYYQLAAEESLPRMHKAKRDKNWLLIEDLVKQPLYLHDIIRSQRNNKLTSYAKAKGTYVQKIYRLLNLYWQFGQKLNALLPAYKLSGGSGTSRADGKVKRGAPATSNIPGLSPISGKNVSEADKLIFKKAMTKYGLIGREVKLSRVYEKMLKEFYADEIIRSESLGVEPSLPTLRSFRYWIKKLFKPDEIMRKQTSQGDYERNKRGLRGSATDHTEVIGSCFEIDATIIDVHVVSEFNRNMVLGRPTLYCVIDKESRMITGIHVSLEYASWRAGRQALVNSFTSKKDYCSRFGIDIEEHEWPCSHIPQRLLCDRGEFICNAPEKLAVPLIGHVSIAPPYRPDLKGIVERFFNTLNNRLFHDLKGTTRGRERKRNDKDPRLEAQLTVTEITRLLIDEVLEHNNNAALKRLASQSKLLIEYNLAPTPLNYWNIHLDSHQHALSKLDEAEIRAQLLPSEKVSMTGEGIRLNDHLCYKCDHEDFEAWKSIARTNGRWQLEARIDHDNSSYIYVRLQPKECFTKCSLVLRSANFEGKHIADVHYFQNWAKREQKRNKPNRKSVERHNRRNQIVSGATDFHKQLPKPKTKSAPIKNIKENRRKAIEENRVRSHEGYDSTISKATNKAPSDTFKEFENQSNVVSMLKRARGDRSEN